MEKLLVIDFSTVRALVIGDALVDMYHFGRCERLSPEAPVPVFVEDSADPRGGARRGGADNVAHQLEVLGCEVKTYFPERRSVKHRYQVDHHCIFRRDSDQHAPTNWWSVVDLHPLIYEFANVVVLSDYAKGALTAGLCKYVIDTCRAAAIPVIVDPKGNNWSRYAGASVICPNHDEWLKIGRLVPSEMDILEKRGAEGIAIHPRGGGTGSLIPARARHVYDVTGAGDVAVACIAAVVGAGGSLEEAAEIACIAAGYSVGEIGTAVCSLEYLCESALRTESSTFATQGTSTSSPRPESTATT